jgi:uncharacterized protein
MIRRTATGVEVDIRVMPRARKTAIDGERDDAVLVRVAAPPIDGAANDEIVRHFADALRLPRRSVRLIGGERGRRKRLALDGVSADAVQDLIRGRLAR